MNNKDSIHSAQALISNSKGLHARASALFVNCAQQFDATITVSRGEESVSAGSIMELLMLAAGPGTTLTINASGRQSKEALAKLVELIDAHFYEDD